jgi:hypothetical protein
MRSSRKPIDSDIAFENTDTNQLAFIAVTDRDFECLGSAAVFSRSIFMQEQTGCGGEML